MTSPHPVTLVAFDGLQLLDLAGPVEVLDAASRLAGHACYDVRIATPGGRTVRTTSGIELGGDVDLAAVAAEVAARPAGAPRSGTLLVVGGRGTRPLTRDDAFLDHLRTAAAGAERITSVCSGALLLGAAGLLDGHRATTHWATCDDLAAVAPAVTVEPDQIYVHDRDRWTSAGVTAGIDLTLALVDADHGPELAHQVAAWLVVFVRRPGGQAQFSAQLRSQAARLPAIAALQAWLPDHLHEDCTVERLAERAGMSARSFARTFRDQTGTTPAAHVEELRIEAARRLLETTDLTVAAIARAVGLRRAETFHRVFRRRVGTTPDRYRQHFARTAS